MPCCWTSEACLVTIPVVHHKLHTASSSTTDTSKKIGSAEMYGPSGKAANTAAWTSCTGSHSKLAPFHVNQCVGERSLPRYRMWFFWRFLLCCKWYTLPQFVFCVTEDVLAKLWPLVVLLAAGWWGAWSSHLIVRLFWGSGSAGPSGSRCWDEVRSAGVSLCEML